MTEVAAFPYPIPEYGSEAYWEACNDGRLAMQRCHDCKKFRWHPAPLCTHCGGADFSWETLSGRGRITTWTVVTHPVHPAAIGKVPYVVIEVELEEQAGLRMLSNLLDGAAADINFDSAVTLDFVTHPNGQNLPVFRLDDTLNLSAVE